MNRKKFSEGLAWMSTTLALIRVFKEPHTTTEGLTSYWTIISTAGVYITRKPSSGSR